MTTAHRPTWNPTSGGKDQGGNRVIVPTKQYSAKDLPGHTVLKYRKIGQNNEIENKSINFRQQLLQKEQAYFDQKKKEAEYEGEENESLNDSQSDQSGSDSESDSDLKHPHKAKFLTSSPAKLNHKLDSESSDEENHQRLDEIDDSDENNSRLDSKPEFNDESSENSDESEQSDFSEADILKEIEKIKSERAEAEKAKREAHEKQLREQQKQEMLKSNPLLDIAPGFELKRKWTEETIFRNQSRTEPSSEPHFVNDTLRSEFHRKFLNRTIM